jgi:hypothetical protein
MGPADGGAGQPCRLRPCCYGSVVIDGSLLRAFETDGAVLVPGLLEPSWIELLREAMPEIREACYDPRRRLAGDSGARESAPATVQADGIWRSCEPFARFLFGSPLGRVAATCMGSGAARLYEDLLLHKDAGAPGGVSWHRDSPHWPLRGDQMSSTWFALEEVGSDTGAMRFVVGSHRDADDMIDAGRIGVTEDEIEARPTVTIEAEPGDVVVFHPRVLHTAYGSAPDRPRRTFTLRFMGDDVRWRPRRAMFHPWMQGCGLRKGDVPDHPWFPDLARV